MKLNNMQCVIISPKDKEKYDSVDGVTLPAAGGEMEVRPGHAEMFVRLREGAVVVEGAKERSVPVTNGVCFIRDDNVLLSEEFDDESMVLVKKMTASDIRMMGGRLFPKIWKMQEHDKKDQYTLLRYHKLEFLDDLPDRLFTVQELKTLRRR